MCRIALLRHSGVLKGEHLCTCCFSCSVNGIGINPELIKRKCFNFQNCRLRKLITELSRFDKANILARSENSIVLFKFNSFLLRFTWKLKRQKNSRARDILRQKKLNGYPPLRALGWNALKID